MLVRGIRGLCKDHPLVAEALEIVKEGLFEADPYLAVKKRIRVHNKTVYIDSYSFTPEKIHVIGFGKASYRMLKGVVDVLGDKLHGGVVIHNGEPARTGKVEVLRGDHPIPGNNTLSASRALLSYIESNVSENDLTIVLISGGGSAMFEVPEEGVTLESLSEVTRLLLGSGSDIYEINTVRKALSKVKGGKLLRYLRGNIVSLIISDVVGDDPSVIASGPTVPEEKGIACRAIGVLKRRRIWDEAPSDVRNYLTKSCDEARFEFVHGNEVIKKIVNIVIASNYGSLRRMKDKAGSLRYNPIILTPYMAGEAREVAKMLAALIKSSVQLEEPFQPPLALIAGGETTVTVRGKGIGGRNQELCLALLHELRNLRGKYVAVCIGSDGIDGNSPAAGSIITNDLYAYAVSQGLDPEEYLENNDSYTLFEKLGCAIITGPTGTNVNDFFVFLYKEKQQYNEMK
ncbi:MAG: glycerate kinase [Fervidicoccaceae archaeon]|nr:glycerate kinase [Fervidicoccaceae archaeon]